MTSRRDVVGTVAIFAAAMAALLAFTFVRDAGHTVGAYVPAGRSAVETGADTPPVAATGGGVGGGQRPATASAAEPVSAPTVNQTAGRQP